MRHVLVPRLDEETRRNIGGQSMQAQGVLFGQIAAVFGIVIAGVWSATQWTAAALGYQLRLGSPWFDLFGTPVYHPWKLFEWWFVFDAYAPRVFDTGGAIAGSSGLVAVVVAIAMSVWRSRQSRLVTTYGSARWAEADDIRKAGLTQPAGVFLGKYRNEYLRHEGPEHVLTFAPTRSGKGVGLVVPTLLSWPASAVIHDIKGENWQITAGRRSRFSHCLLFNPTDAWTPPANESGRLLFLRDEPQPNPRFGDDVARSGGIVPQLVAQLAHENAQVVGIFLVRRPPHLPQYLCLRHQPSRLPDQQGQQRELLAAQRDGFSMNGHFPLRQFDSKNPVVVNRAILRPCRHRAQECANACHQFLDTERLGHVVVGPCVQQGHLFVLAGAYRQHDDGHARPLPQFLEHVFPVHIRQPQVQDDEVGPFAGQQRQALSACSRQQGRVALRPQADVDELADLGFVIDEKNPGGRRTRTRFIGKSHHALSSPDSRIRPKAGSGGGWFLGLPGQAAPRRCPCGHLRYLGRSSTPGRFPACLGRHVRRCRTYRRYAVVLPLECPARDPRCRSALDRSLSVESAP